MRPDLTFADPRPGDKLRLAASWPEELKRGSPT